MGGVDIYLASNLPDTKFSFNARDIKSLDQLLDTITNHFNLSWKLRGGFYLVSAPESIDNPEWIPQATILRGHGSGVFARQNAGELDKSNALYMNIKIGEYRSEQDFGTSEMAVLINQDKPIGLRQGGLYLHFKAQSDDQLIISLFEVNLEGKMEIVGADNLKLSYEAPMNLRWQTDSTRYELTLDVKPHKDKATQS